MDFNDKNYQPHNFFISPDFDVLVFPFDIRKQTNKQTKKKKKKRSRAMLRNGNSKLLPFYTWHMLPSQMITLRLFLSILICLKLSFSELAKLRSVTF